MSLYLTEEAAEQIKEIDSAPSLFSADLHILLKNISENKSYFSQHAHKVSSVNEEIYVLRHRNTRLFFAKKGEDLVLINVVKKIG
jgi:hypothetical protein